MIYGIRNIVSEEVQEKLDIASLYLNIINEDTYLFGEDYITEAEDKKKLSSTIKNKITSAIGTVTELFGKLIGKIQKAFSTLLEKMEAGAVDHLKKKASKMGTITIPASAKLRKPVSSESPVKKAVEKVKDIEEDVKDLILRYGKTVEEYNKDTYWTTEEQDDGWHTYKEEKYSPEDRLHDVEKTMSLNYDWQLNKIDNDVKSMNLDDIFFETDEVGEFGITGQELSKIIEAATNKNLYTYIQDQFKKMSSDMNSYCDQCCKDIDEYYKLYSADSIKTDQEYIDKIVALFNKYSSKLINICCNDYGAMGIALTNSYTKYTGTVANLMTLAFSSKQLKKLEAEDNEEKLKAGAI